MPTIDDTPREAERHLRRGLREAQRGREIISNMLREGTMSAAARAATEAELTRLDRVIALLTYPLPEEPVARLEAIQDRFATIAVLLDDAQSEETQARGLTSARQPNRR